MVKFIVEIGSMNLNDDTYTIDDERPLFWFSDNSGPIMFDSMEQAIDELIGYYWMDLGVNMKVNKEFNFWLSDPNNEIMDVFMLECEPSEDCDWEEMSGSRFAGPFLLRAKDEDRSTAGIS